MILFFSFSMGAGGLFFCFFFYRSRGLKLANHFSFFFFGFSFWGFEFEALVCVFHFAFLCLVPRGGGHGKKKKIGESGNHLRIFFSEGKKPSLGNWRKKKECRWRNESVGMKKSFEISTTKNKFVPKNGTRTTKKRRANEATKPPDCISQFQLS